MRRGSGPPASGGAPPPRVLCCYGLGRLGVSTMLRLCARIIALAAMVASPSMTAQPADATLTLACQGSVTGGTEDAKPEPISMGIIVNFTKRTVQGFGSPGFRDYPVEITAWNDVTVVFAGSEDTRYSRASITGSIDRVTGDVDATSTVSDAKTGKTIGSTNYALKCRPTQRMF
jgi:hypothetical protein